MKKSSQAAHLVKELNRDPRLKPVIYKAKRGQRKSAAKIESFGDLFLLSLAIVSRFVSKKKARKLDELMDVVYLLVLVSLLLKENIFDRPEVKNFLNQQSKRILSTARGYVDWVLSKADDVKGFRFRRT